MSELGFREMKELVPGDEVPQADQQSSSPSDANNTSRDGNHNSEEEPSLLAGKEASPYTAASSNKKSNTLTLEPSSSEHSAGGRLQVGNLYHDDDEDDQINHGAGDDLSDEDDDDERHLTCKEKFIKFLKTAGPGIVVMLADTDASCIITAADSGKEWGYSLVLIQFLLIPPLYMAQELTVRIAAVEKKGLGRIVKEKFGPKWGWFSVGTLLLTCAGGLVSEFTSTAGAFEIFGIPTWVSAGILLITMALVVLTGSYKRVEILAAIMGMAELTFVVTMFMVKPDMKDLGEGLVTVPIRQTGYLLLFSANIGAVIMPWMIFYQCSAVAAKGLKKKEIKNEKIDTVIGAFLTQFIMTAVVITTAATAWNGKYDGSSEAFATVGDIALALSSVIGDFAGKLLFVLGLTGGAMIGCVVVSLTGAWALTEVTGSKNSLDSSPKDAPVFYASYMVLLLLAFLVAISGVDIVLLNVVVQTMNTLLLPIVLVCLTKVACQLPPQYALSGKTKIFYIAIFALVALIGLVTGIIGLVYAF